jgi:FMN phosphatase YigB (HAD superfamily)
MPKKQIIAVDLDDVLGNENHAMMRFINQRHGFKHTPDDYNVIGDYGPYWWDIWGVGEEKGREWYEEFVEAKLTEKIHIEPLTGALEVLRHLKEHFDLVIITSRRAILAEVSEKWLVEHYPKLFNGIHFVEVWGKGAKVTKAQICNEIGAAYLIDDNAEHCKFAQEAGVQALLFGDYGWNRAISVAPGVIRVGDWRAVQEYFDGKRS